MESPHQINWRLNWLLEDHFTPENMIGVLDDYTQVEAVSTLLDKADSNARTFRDEAKMASLDYVYISYLLKQTYENLDRGEGHSSYDEELHEIASDLIEGNSLVLRTLRHIREGFILLEKQSPSVSINPLEIVSGEEYRRRLAEPGLCNQRCMESITVVNEDYYDAFNFVSSNIRSVDRPGPDERETVYDYGDCWYEIIMSLAALSVEE